MASERARRASSIRASSAAVSSSDADVADQRGGGRAVDDLFDQHVGAGRVVEGRRRVGRGRRERREQEQGVGHR